jgi:hypothetical protein
MPCAVSVLPDGQECSGRADGSHGGYHPLAILAGRPGEDDPQSLVLTVDSEFRLQREDAFFTSETVTADLGNVSSSLPGRPDIVSPSRNTSR